MFKKLKLKSAVDIKNHFDYILGNRREPILKNGVTCWSSSLHSIYISNFFNLHSDMEVCKTDMYHSCTIIIPAIISQEFKTISLLLNFRFIKSDTNIIKLNICGSLILSYAMFISLVEQTANEVKIDFSCLFTNMFSSVNI